MVQQTPARVCLGDFPDEILSLIFSHVDTATLLGAVPHVCRGWLAACGDKVYGPKVCMELRSVQQVLCIRYECMELWVKATMGRFAWVIDLDFTKSNIEDGVLESAGSMQFVTSLNLSWCKKITDTGLEHLAKLLQLTSLNLTLCGNITNTGRALVHCLRS